MDIIFFVLSIKAFLHSIISSSVRLDNEEFNSSASFHERTIASINLLSIALCIGYNYYTNIIRNLLQLILNKKPPHPLKVQGQKIHSHYISVIYRLTGESKWITFTIIETSTEGIGCGLVTTFIEPYWCRISHDCLAQGFKERILLSLLLLYKLLFIIPS